MNNPKLRLDPDTYGGNYWRDVSQSCYPARENDFCGVHHNSGVMNFWFYLLTEGSAGTDGVNDLGNCYYVSGIGIEKAANIVYKGEKDYLTPTSKFIDARSSMIQAARDIYGDASSEVVAVTNAWYAVGVGAGYTYGTNPIVGNYIVCTAGSTQTLSGAPAVSSFTWNATPSYLFQTSTGSGYSATLHAANSTTSGLGTITFLPGPCSGSTTPITKSVWVGIPAVTVHGDPSPYPGQIYNYTASPWYLDGSGPPYGWEVSGGSIFGGGGSLDFVSIYWLESGYVTLTSQNFCGYNTSTLYIEPSTEGGCNPCQNGDAYPNPVSTILNIDLNNDGRNRIEYTVTLSNEFEKVYSITTRGNQANIPVHNLPNGYYYLSVASKSGTTTQRVYVNH